MMRSMDSHQYQPAPYNQVGYQGSVKSEYVNNVLTTWAVSRPTSFPASPYPAQIPVARGNSFNFAPTQPRTEMDPSNPATWQRQYRFTS